jgi:hypothetical protein
VAFEREECVDAAVGFVRLISRVNGDSKMCLAEREGVLCWFVSASGRVV